VLNKDLPYKSKGTWYKFKFVEKHSLEPSFFPHGGGHFKKLRILMRGWVGDKLALLGAFLVQIGMFLVVQIFISVNLGSNIWILAPHSEFALYIWFLCQNLKIESFWRVWVGGGVGPPGPSGGFSSVSGKNISPNPWEAQDRSNLSPT